MKNILYRCVPTNWTLESGNHLICKLEKSENSKGKEFERYIMVKRWAGNQYTTSLEGTPYLASELRSIERIEVVSTVRFYEGSYQFFSEDIYLAMEPSYIQAKLSELYNYRATKENLWATVIQNGQEVARYRLNVETNILETITTTR